METGASPQVGKKMLVAVEFFLQLWPFVLFKKSSQTCKRQVKLKIHTTLKYIANKIIVLAQFFWIRRMVKVAEKNQQRQIFWNGWSINLGILIHQELVCAIILILGGGRAPFRVAVALKKKTTTTTETVRERKLHVNHLIWIQYDKSAARSGAAVYPWQKLISKRTVKNKGDYWAFRNGKAQAAVP
jgi:hypothetical protein